MAHSWQGGAQESFDAKLTAYEEALSGEADDMETVAVLLETAAEACATAEQLMIDLIMEILETVAAALVTSAILSLVTAGVAAAIGPVVATAGVATKVLRAVKITASLADKLTDIAKRLKAIRRAEKLAQEMKRLGAGKKVANSYRNGLKRFRAKDEDGNRLGTGADLTEYAIYQGVKKGVKKGVVAPALGNDVGEPIGQAMTEFSDEGTAQRHAEYDARPASQSFDERMHAAESASDRDVRSTFG
ncbi:hypothetical protein [Streptomyces fractus]|uniref:hypothetical protein n=1 Tax=Streptomyces fractus TaxID=641806 RepID=UPI003CF5FA48